MKDITDIDLDYVFQKLLRYSITSQKELLENEWIMEDPEVLERRFEEEDKKLWRQFFCRGWIR